MKSDELIPDGWVWLEGVECPNCMGAFLFAPMVDADNAPGEVRCASCGMRAQSDTLEVHGY